MNLAALAIKNKITMLVIAILLIGGGILAFDKLGQLEDPEFTIKDAQIITLYPGASAKEVAEEVTERVENAVQQLPQLKEVRSLSQPGISIVTPTIQDKYDKSSLPQVWDELRRRITDMQSELPIGAGPSVVQDDFGDVYGILIAINGKGYSYKELEDYADFLKRELLLVPSVGKIQIYGIQPQEVHLEISQTRLSQLGISLDDVLNTLNNQNLVLPSGQVRAGVDLLRIKPTGTFSTVKEIGNLLIQGSKPGQLIYLKDVGTIKRSYQEPSKLLVRHNGDDSLVLGISIVSGGNVVIMGDLIKQKLKQLQPLTPLGLQTHIITFQSDYVEEAISGFLISLVEALLIVIAVLVIFMGFRSSLVISLSLLLTILGTFIFMKLWGINLERISLGALIIALGMLVDNAIVINEGILVKSQQGMKIAQAAKEVVQQSMWPLLGATVIAILAFAGIGLSQDATGEYTRSLFQVILISLSLSWIIAVTLTPLLCLYLLKPAQKTDKVDSQEVYKGFIFSMYKAFLTTCLRFRIGTLAVLLLLLGLSIYGFARLENSFFPESTRDQFMVHFWLPEGTDIRVTSEEVKQLESYIKTLPNVTDVTSFIGQGAPRFILTYTPEKAYSSYAFLLVKVKDYESIPAAMQKIETYSDTHFLNAMVKLRKFVLGPSKEDTLEFRFIGSDPNVLRQLANQAKAIMYADGDLMGIKDDWRERVKVIRPQFSEVQARDLGISKSDLDNALQMTYSGLTAAYYREFNKILPIKVYAPEEERKNVNEIGNIYLWSPIAEKTIPLRQITTGIDLSWEDAAIQKFDKQLTVTAQATQASGSAITAFNRVAPLISQIQLPPGYKMEFGGEYEKTQDAQTALFAKIPVIVILMFGILVVMFNAIRQPLIIAMTLPLAIIGVTLALLVTNQSFGFMALLGFLSLSGMLIKNSVVLIDQIDLEIREGKDRFNAVVDSSISRLRPVAMAAITTILGMIPLVFDVFFIGMAVTIMGGLAFATVLTMIIVPVLYCILFQISYPKN